MTPRRQGRRISGRLGGRPHPISSPCSPPGGACRRPTCCSLEEPWDLAALPDFRSFVKQKSPLFSASGPAFCPTLVPGAGASAESPEFRERDGNGGWPGIAPKQPGLGAPLQCCGMQSAQLGDQPCKKSDAPPMAGGIHIFFCGQTPRFRPQWARTLKLNSCGIQNLTQPFSSGVTDQSLSFLPTKGTIILLKIGHKVSLLGSEQYWRTYRTTK